MASKKQEKQAQQYIKEYSHLYDPKLLRESLIKSGYEPSVIDAVLTRGGSSWWRRTTNSIKEAFSSTSFSHWYLWTGIAVLILVLIGIIGWSSQSINCGYDKTCFIEQANNGNSVKVQEDFAGSTLEYRYKDGELTKEIIAFSEDEPQEVVDLLKGKTLTCPAEGIVDEYIDSLLSGIEFCEGDLKDIVYDIDILIE